MAAEYVFRPDNHERNNIRFFPFSDRLSLEYMTIYSGFAVRTFRGSGIETLSALMNTTSGTGAFAGAVGGASHTCLESSRPTQCIVSGFVEFPGARKRGHLNSQL
jgi:hypothetical protein